MRILVLGGTAWVGGEIARQALERGHEVVCLARGTSGAVPSGAVLVRADRDADGAYDVIAGERWDAVVDVARQPGHVRRAVRALEPAASRYLLVSTGNVYADHARPNQDEDAALLPPLEGDVMPDMAAYGPAKVACEQAVLAAFGAGRCLIARSGLIGGPGDVSGRSGAWPWRFAHPADPDGAVLVPEAAQRPCQLIDVRDLTAWLVRAAEEGRSGAFNATGPDSTLGEHLATARRVAGHHGALAVAPEAWLTEQGVEEWMGPRSLALWLHDPEWQGFAARDSSRARGAGLTHRPLEQTLADVLAWEAAQPEHPHGAGLTDAEERTLLAALRAR